MEIQEARKGVCDLILDTQDVLHFRIKMLEDCKDIHLLYGEVWLCEDPTQGRVVCMYQKLLLGSVHDEFPVTYWVSDAR